MGGAGEAVGVRGGAGEAVEDMGGALDCSTGEPAGEPDGDGLVLYIVVVLPIVVVLHTVLVLLIVLVQVVSAICDASLSVSEYKVFLGPRDKPTLRRKERGHGRSRSQN
jgi:hypothetical protein